MAKRVAAEEEQGDGDDDADDDNDAGVKPEHAFALGIYHALPEELRLTDARVSVASATQCQLRFADKCVLEFEWAKKEARWAGAKKDRGQLLLTRESQQYFEDAGKWNAHLHRTPKLQGGDWKDGLSAFIAASHGSDSAARAAQWVRIAQYIESVAVTLHTALSFDSVEEARKLVAELEMVVSPFEPLHAQIERLDNLPGEGHVTVTVPRGEVGLGDWQGKTFAANIVYDMPRCDGVVVTSLASGEMKLVPCMYVADRGAQPKPEPEQWLFQIPQGVVDDDGNDVGGEWTEATVLAELPDDYLLMRIAKYEPSNWFAGYEVVKKESAQIKRKPPKAPKKKRKGGKRGK